MRTRFDRRFVIPVAAAVVALTGPTSAQNGWTTFQSNAAHDGHLQASIDTSVLSLSWSAQLDTYSLYQASAADSRVYVSGGHKGLWVLDAATGDVLWTHAYSGAFSVNPPAYADGRVYMQTCNHSSDTWLRCFDAQTGDVRFTAPHTAQWENYYAPTIVDGVAYVNGGSYGGMYAFDATAGQQLWFVSLAQYDEWTPAVDSSYAYAYVGGTLSAVGRASGTVAFTITDPNFSWQGWSIQLAPVLGGRNDIFIVHDGRLVRFDLAGRRISYELPTGYAGQPAVHNGVVYVVSSGLMQCRDQDDGHLLWSWEQSNENLLGGVAVTDTHAIVRSGTHTFAVDLTTHQSTWSVDRTGEITIAQGAIYIAEQNGRLSCYRYAQLPEPQSVAPNRHHFAQAASLVTVQGANFVGHGAVSVWFGDEEATEVQVVDDQTIRCRIPPLGPGQVDVTVANDLGRRRLASGFTYYPATGLSGDYRIGGYVSVSYASDLGDQVLGLIGVPSAPVPLPPFVGSLGLDPVLPLIYLPIAFGESQTIAVQIPRDSSLRGGRIGFQALVAPQPRAGVPFAAYFTNSPVVEIQ